MAAGLGTDREGFAAMVRHVHQWPDRAWAIESGAGVGKHIALRLLAYTSCRRAAQAVATGRRRKTDATTDAHFVALVGTRMSWLRSVVNDEQLVALRLLVDRRRWLGEASALHLEVSKFD